MKPTIWIFSLEPIETRYTKQWQDHIPTLLKDNVGDKFNVVQIDGVQKNSQLTPGAFLNFSDTNYWKSSQLCNFLELYNQGKTSPDDHFLFTDAWNPTIIQIKYMKELLGFKWILHGLFHAGSYDSQDFLGRLIGDAPWVRYSEKAFFSAIDHNYFATDFHIKMFVENLLEVPQGKITNVAGSLMREGKIVRSGWPMEYMPDTLMPYKSKDKRDLILFPHRIAPEKQVEIFRDLALELPEYEWVVCQEQNLTKDEYHTLLGESKMVFSANLQETLGISMYEACLVDSIPLVPDRLSYSEMFAEVWKYPSFWTESFDSYLEHKQELIALIRKYMSEYHDWQSMVPQQAFSLHMHYFSATALLNNIK
jgi:hypothetical protein